MEDNKKFFLAVILAFCIVLVGASCFWLGLQFADKNVDISEKNSENEINLAIINEKFIDNINVSRLLSNYLNSKENDFAKYLNELDNNYKLFVGNISDGISFKQIENKLVTLFGNNIGVESKDYYQKGLEFNEPVYMYNKDTGKYNYNTKTPGSDVDGYDLDYIYNYKLKDIKTVDNKLEILYYGLYGTLPSGIGPATVTNNKNIDRMLDFQSQMEFKDQYAYTDEDYFEKMFSENKNNFYQFKYIIEIKDGNYILTNIEKI